MEERVLRTTASPTQAGEWALVLAAAGIAYRVDERQVHERQGDERPGDERPGDRRQDGFAILVAPEDEAGAAEALASFEAEGAPEPEPPAPDRGPSPLGLLCAVGFSALFLVTGARDGGSRWFDAGAASAALIAKGAWWRAVTALTLHADVLHLAGNVIASLVFISAVGRWLGAGLGGGLILLSATVANLLTAAVHRTDFVSIGASTATFAALGLVAGLQVVRRIERKTRRLYAWVPIGAGLGLFAMLGVGIGADYFAHLFGLGVGMLVGAGVALGQTAFGWRPPGRVGQLLWAAADLAVVGLCWLRAFSR
jgi:rhomboid protease GluP